MLQDTKHNQGDESKSTHSNIVNVLRKISHVGVHIPYTHLEEDESSTTRDERPPESRPDFTAITVRERKISNNRAIYAKYLDGNNSTKVDNSIDVENETPLKYVEINSSEKDTTTIQDPQIQNQTPAKKKKIFGGLMAAPVWRNRDKYFNDDESITENKNSNDNQISNSIYKQIFTWKRLAGIVFIILVIVVLTWTLLSEIE